MTNGSMDQSSQFVATILIFISEVLSCYRKGVRMKNNPDEPWLPPVRTSSNELEKEESSRSSIFRKLRNKDTASLPLNIPSSKINHCIVYLFFDMKIANHK